MDVLNRKQRSYNMSMIKGQNTSPELKVIELVRSQGHTFTLHDRSLPGRPDIILLQFRKVIFVHGCFWHRHSCKYGKPKPATNRAFWVDKFVQNVARDRRNRIELRRLGWQVLIVWECQVKKNSAKVAAKVSRFLAQQRAP